MSSMLKRVLNCPERITYHRLSETCARRSAQVFAKVRLADVLPVEGSGLSSELYEFALQAHYDFVITDLAQQPLFAVEFDGPGHNNLVQARRDTKKDELSRRFRLPLLRILADDLRRSEWRLDRLTEVTEQWFDGGESELVQRLVERKGPVADPHVRGGNVTEWPSCPLCGSGMILKNGKYGPFLSCDRFPSCRGSCDIPGPSTLSRSQAGAASPTRAVPLPRWWLIAGLLVVMLILTLLVVLIARSSFEGARTDRPALVVARADRATVRQMNLLGLLIRRRGWDAAERDKQIELVLKSKRGFTELSKQEASKLITAWDDRRK